MHMSFSCKFTDQKVKQLVKNMLILLLLPEVANRDRTYNYSDNAQQNNKYQPKDFYIEAYMMQGFPDWGLLPRPVMRCNTGRLVL